MTDKYVKRVLTVIAIALCLLALETFSTGMFSTHAQTKTSRRCVWTYVTDEGSPNIGRNGEVDFSKGQNWKRLSDEGWELKAFARDKYIFERCE